LRENAGDVCLAIDANCGVIDTGECYLYELTPRTGYPISALIEFLLAPNVGNFFIGLIEGNPWTGRWKNGWGVVTVLGSGQYPDEGDSHDGCFKDQPVRMEIDDHIAPFFIRWDEDKTYYRIADYYEYVAGVNYVGDDIIETNQKCVEKMQEIDVRAPHYRHDIGTKFVEIEIPELIKLGYL
jgi:phosphoribosylamine-glycine ligase